MCLHSLVKNLHDSSLSRSCCRMLALPVFILCIESVLYQERCCLRATKVRRQQRHVVVWTETLLWNHPQTVRALVFSDRSDGMWAIQEIKQRVGVINHTEHKQTQAWPLFFHSELMNVPKNLNPTVLFPCVVSEGVTEKTRKGGRVGSTTASSLSSGNAVWGLRRKCVWCVCELEKGEEKGNKTEWIKPSQLYSNHHKYAVKEEHSVRQTNIENDSRLPWVIHEMTDLVGSTLRRESSQVSPYHVVKSRNC